MLPTKVTVCGLPFTVRTDSTMDAKTDEWVDGEITYNLCDVRMASNMPLAYEQRVLMHELIHALFSCTGHDEYRNDEKLVDTLAHGLVQVIQANPDLVRYLTETT